MKKKLLFSVALLPAIAIACLVGHLSYLYTHPECGPKDFSYSYELEPNVPVVVSEETKENILKALDQKFIYLSRGQQMTAFESEDHRYVIKFYNPRTFVKESWFHDFRKMKRLCSMKWISGAYIKRKEKLSKISKCNRLAFADLKDESGILYVHFNAATMIPKMIEVIDKDENVVLMDLRKCPFVLQDKVIIATKYFDDLLREGKTDEMKASIANLADLFISRALKGYSDRIQTLHNNYGFLNNRPIQLDVGKLVKTSDGSSMPPNDIMRIFRQLEGSIAEKYPEFEIYTKELLEFKLEEYKQKIAKR